MVKRHFLIADLNRCSFQDLYEASQSVKYQAATFPWKSSAERQVDSASTTKDTLVMLQVCAVGQAELLLILWLSRSGVGQCALQLPPGLHALILFLFETQEKGRECED